MQSKVSNSPSPQTDCENISISICPSPLLLLRRSSPPLTWPRFAHPPLLVWIMTGREGRSACNDDLPFHKSNPLFIPGAARHPPPSSSPPHLAAAYTFIPRGIAAAGRGNRGTTSARMGTSPDSSRPDSPRDFAPTEPVSPVQCFRSHAVLFGNGEIIA